MSFARFLGGALHALAKLPGALPLSWQRALGRGFGGLARMANMRESRIARRNLELLGVPAAEHDALVRAILASTGANLMETLRVWTHPQADNMPKLLAATSISTQAIASSSGLFQ